MVPNQNGKCRRCGVIKDRPDRVHCAKCRVIHSAESKRWIESPQGRDYHRNYDSLYRKLPEPRRRKHARVKAQQAFWDGKITQTSCEDCGASSQEMHHDNYDKPLEVTWLCKSCHQIRHDMFGSEGARVQWEVLWMKDGKVFDKDFGESHSDALDLYVKLHGKREMVTLRSKNVGFPPPDRYADRDEKGRLILPRTFEHRMGMINLKGLWWCSYCQQLRRFIKTDCFVIDGIQVDEPAMSCPLCGASNRLNTIQRYNPKSNRYTESMRRTRSDKGSKR